MAPKNDYQFLQADPDAEPGLLGSAFEGLAKLDHHDMIDAPAAASQTRAIDEAMGVWKH